MSESQNAPLRKALRIILLSMNTEAMNIHHNIYTHGNQLWTLGCGWRGFSTDLAVSHGGSMSETSKTVVKPISDVYVYACGDVVGSGSG